MAQVESFSIIGKHLLSSKITSKPICWCTCSETADGLHLFESILTTNWVITWYSSGQRLHLDDDGLSVSGADKLTSMIVFRVFFTMYWYHSTCSLWNLWRCCRSTIGSTRCFDTRTLWGGTGTKLTWWSIITLYEISCIRIYQWPLKRPDDSFGNTATFSNSLTRYSDEYTTWKMVAIFFAYKI